MTFQVSPDVRAFHAGATRHFRDVAAGLFGEAREVLLGEAREHFAFGVLEGTALEAAGDHAARVSGVGATAAFVERAEVAGDVDFAALVERVSDGDGIA